MSNIVYGGTRAWLNWTVAVSFVLLVFALQTGYAITSVHVAGELGLSLVQVGIVGSIYTWVFAIAQFSSGAILDRMGGQRVLPIAACLVTIGALLFANAQSVWMLLAAQVFLAIGASYGFIGAGFVGGQWFAPAKYGFMFALVQLFASLSAVVGQQTINVAIQTYHWSSIINGMAIMGLFVVILMVSILRDPAGAREHATWPGLRQFAGELVADLKQVAGIRDAWTNALIGGATFGTMLALGVVWGPRWLVAGGMDQVAANSAISYSWFGLALGAPAFAWVSDKWRSRKKPMALGCVLQLVTILIVLARPDIGAEEASFWFFVWGFMAGGSMIAFTVGMELVDKSMVGTSAALVNATQFIVAGIMMTVPGRVLAGSGVIARFAGLDGTSERTVADFQWALLVYPLALGSASLLFLFLRETHPDVSTPTRR